jgi:hypothetical protein
MKIRFIFLIPIVLLYTNYSVTGEEVSRIVGLSTGTKLNCRTTPNLKSDIKHQFLFGDLIYTSDFEKKKDTVDNINGYWLHISGYNCWIFDSYIKRISFEEVSVLHPEEYHCIGTEGYTTYPIFLIKGTYIAFYETFIGPAPTPKRSYIEIGNYHRSGKKIVFNPLIASMITPLGKIRELQKTVRGQWKLIKNTDESGEYFSTDHTAYLRPEAKIACQENAELTKEAPWTEFFSETNSSSSEYKEFLLNFRLVNRLSEQDYNDWIESGCKPDQIYNFKCELDN